MKVITARTTGWIAHPMLYWSAAVVLLCAPTFIYPHRFIPDDALFYSQVAYNLATTGKITFNGIAPTNGFQPLWLMTQAALFALGRINRAQGLYAVLALNVALMFLLAAFYRRLAIRMELGESLLGVAILLVAFCSNPGMESQLSAVLIANYGIQFLRCYGTRASSQWAILGLLAGLLVLARLDNAILVAWTLALLVWTVGLRSTASFLLASALPMALLLLPYFAYNQSEFGHLTPISIAIKSSFPLITGDIRNVGRSNAVHALVALLGLLILTPRTPPAARIFFQALSLAVLSQIAAFWLFSRAMTESWYYVMGYFDRALVLDLLVAVAGRSLSPAVSVRAFVSALCVVLLALTFRDDWLWARDGLGTGAVQSRCGTGETFADWVREHVPAGSRVAVFDFPGIIAYETEVAVVPLDGLMGDYGYEETLAREGLAKFLADSRVEYLFVPVVEPGRADDWGFSDRAFLRTTGAVAAEKLELFSPLTGRPAGSITLDRRSLVTAFRRRCGEDSSETGADFGIWKLAPEAAR